MSPWQPRSRPGTLADALRGTSDNALRGIFRGGLHGLARGARLCLLALLLGGTGACGTMKTLAPLGIPQSGKQADAGRAAGARGQHTVVKGDTLYSIAWRYGYDYKTLATWNRIRAPFTIYPGQVIRFKPEQARGTAAAGRPAGAQPRDKPARGAGTDAVRWRWPARGKLLKSSSPIAKKGINIGARAGAKIVAAAGGVVVYSGRGLRGYGNLIIIKHNNTYLSAYAHNRELVVNEGQTVAAGQQIATMGLDARGVALLHFEIRRNGKPIDPLKQLPRS